MKKLEDFLCKKVKIDGFIGGLYQQTITGDCNTATVGGGSGSDDGADADQEW